MNTTVWQCEQLRAGKVYSRMLFGTQREAEEFMRRMARVQPDIFWKLEPVPMSAVWN